MATAWKFKKDGTEHGPVDSTELKRLANDGQIRPFDLIQRNGAGEWYRASSVKGLFPEAVDSVSVERGQQQRGAVRQSGTSATGLSEASPQHSDTPVTVAAKGSEQPWVQRWIGCNSWGTTAVCVGVVILGVIAKQASRKIDRSGDSAPVSRSAQPISAQSPDLGVVASQSPQSTRGSQVSRATRPKLPLEQMLGLISIGMTKEDVISRLGPPDESREGEFGIVIGSGPSTKSLAIPAKCWTYYNCVVNPDTQMADEYFQVWIGDANQLFERNYATLKDTEIHAEQGWDFKGKVISRQWQGSLFDPYHLPDSRGRR